MSAWFGDGSIALRADSLLLRADGLVAGWSARLMPERDRYRQYLVPALAVIIAAVLRFVDLGRFGLNSDEAVYAGQSASLAGNPHFVGIFPVVRAHPLLLQMLMSPLYRSGVPDVPGRYVAAFFGVATVAMVYVLGRVLYDHRVASLACVFVAVMPYHVIISRQIILDGPMTFFATVGLTCIAMAASNPHHARWLVAAGASLGLAALSKETGLLFVGSAFVFLSLVNHLWRPIRFPLVGAVVALTITLAYPILTALSGGSSGGQSYLLYQLTRQPNHALSFYPITVAKSFGPVLLLIAALGLVFNQLSRRSFTWRETLLLSWASVPVLFFEVWPVKGFSYMLPLVPVAALLCARALVPLPQLVMGHRIRMFSGLLVAVVLVSLAIPAVLSLVQPPSSGLAATGGTPGGREASRWIDANVPQGSRLITIGPSMANMIEYYSGRRSDGLSVSPNPLHRNPSYQSIINADAELKHGNFQYIVWDAYSAKRSPRFARRAMDLVHRFSGEMVHTQWGTFHGVAHQKLVIVYAVRP